MKTTQSNIDHKLNEEVIDGDIDLQGHRGCRGLMPENSLPGFQKALELGVKTLEMDVVISKDNKVVLSHEPWFSHEIALDSTGKEISLSDETTHRIYGMTYDEVVKYDCGSKSHPRFPEQAKIAVSKPLLAQVIDSAETFSINSERPLPYYNIETKSKPQGDDIFHPKPEKFVDLLIGVVKEKEILERTIIQSFDIRTLQVCHEKYPEIALALLIEDKGSPEDFLENLGFTPEIYSPDYALVDEELVAFCREKGMKLIPWTVNETDAMEKLIEMGVDGIITDYPDRYPGAVD